MDAKTAFYTFYILMWPALTLGVLVYIVRAVWRDVKEARDGDQEVL
ncbi:MAG TPA: putative transporter small subunit [Alcanivoracaceae bacterium]|nr:putative transporter small subunit [Alcanivoracaceae bacterium]